MCLARGEKLITYVRFSSLFFFFATLFLFCFQDFLIWFFSYIYPSYYIIFFQIDDWWLWNNQCIYRRVCSSLISASLSKIFDCNSLYLSTSSPARFARCEKRRNTRRRRRKRMNGSTRATQNAGCDRVVPVSSIIVPYRAFGDACARRGPRNHTRGASGRKTTQRWAPCQCR